MNGSCSGARLRLLHSPFLLLYPLLLVATYICMYTKLTFHIEQYSLVGQQCPSVAGTPRGRSGQPSPPHCPVPGGPDPPGSSPMEVMG